MDFAFSTVKDLREALDKKEVSALELAKFFLARIKKYNSELNAFITITEEEALAQAKAADEVLAKGEGGLLTGILYAAKDLYSTKGVKTTAASKILENFVPVYDATVIAKLKTQGAVLLGKTNLDQFAHGSSTETSAFGPSKNPWDVKRIPGGSSGGSTAAVAAGLAPFALATETGGSIRQPASLCGISGWKPTYGRVSRFGVIAMTSSTDSMGTVALTVEDLAMTAEVLSGYDGKDATTGQKQVPEYHKLLSQDLSGLTVGVPKEYFVSAGMEEDVEKRVKEAIEEIRRLKAKIKSVSLPLTAVGSMVYAIITPSEVSSNLSRYDGIKYGHVTKAAGSLMEIYTKSRGEGFGDEAKRRIMTGAYALSAGYRDQYYLKAQRVRRLLVNEFVKVFQEVDVLLCPSSPNVAIKIGRAADDPLFGYVADQLNIPASLAGLPALSVPCGFGRPKDKAEVELPVGLQIIGPQWGEEKIFQVGYAYQQTTDFHKQRPSGY